MSRYLIIGAHPDDADLRFGGTAFKLTRAGHQVKFVSVANGNCGHQSMSGAPLAARRFQEAQRTRAFNGACEYEVLDNSDCEVMPDLPTRKRLIAVIRGFAPDVVLSHRLCDYHADHRNTAQLVLDCAYLVKVPMFVPEAPVPAVEPVFGYFWDDFTDPRPPHVDAAVPLEDDVVEQKCRALDCHVSQFYEWLPFDSGFSPIDPVATPWPRRLEYLKEHWMQRNIRSANAARELLRRRYGVERGDAIRYTENFEYSPYGRHVTPEEFQALFPA